MKPTKTKEINVMNDDKLMILVYGMEIFNIDPSDEGFDEYELHFRSIGTECCFNDYDGVIVVQSAFERFFEKKSHFSYKKNIEFSCLRDELLQRENELRILIEKKGFVCFLMCQPTTKEWNYQSITDTDLSKRVLNANEIDWDNFREPTTDLKIVRNEFLDFLKQYGTATTWYSNTTSNGDIKPICYTNHHITGFVISGNTFFIPVLTPNNQTCLKLCNGLASSILSCRKKVYSELPSWASDYQFETEKSLIAEKIKLAEKIKHIDEKLNIYNEYKKSLCFDSDLLNDSIIAILTNGFGFNLDIEDNLREDLKILNEDNEPIILIENKGTAKNVKREHINQTDSHRERNDLPDSFPSILIVNTMTRSSKSIEDKYKEVAPEQVRHAAHMKILILRTIDLLNLYSLKEKGSIDSKKVFELLQTKIGWLEATQESYKIKNGAENE